MGKKLMGLVLYVFGLLVVCWFFLWLLFTMRRWLI